MVKYTAKNPCESYNNGECSTHKKKVGTWFQDPCVSCKEFKMRTHHLKYNICIEV